MCLQLLQNINISFEIYTNMSGGLWEAARVFEEVSGKVHINFGEGSGGGSEQQREMFGPAQGSQRQTPCRHLYIIVIILLRTPSSELAIREYFIGNMCKCVPADPKCHYPSKTP